jgi:hypothetical protein
MPVVLSWTNTSAASLKSLGTRFVAIESKATTWPSALIAGPAKRPLTSLPWVPSVLTLTRSVRPVPAVTDDDAVNQRIEPTVTASATPRIAWLLLALDNAASFHRAERGRGRALGSGFWGPSLKRRLPGD